MRSASALVIAGVLFVSSCGGEDDSSSDTVAATVPVTATTPATTEAPAPATTAPNSTEAPAPFDSTTLQEMLLDAQPGDVIEIPAGRFSFDRSLSLDVDDVTIRGAGIDETVLTFADQVVGAEGLLVSASNFTIEHLAIEDTVGDALKINEGDNITIRAVRTEWTGDYSTDNGAYGIYPVQTSNVLIEDSVAIGASDAGIYVGQSNDIVVRNNRAEFNVAGIEIENSTGADVYGNVATNNTAGVLVFNLPGLSQFGADVRIFDNEIVGNNIENFAPEGTVVSVAPAGSGVLILAHDRVEIFDNRIADNRSANIIVAAGSTVAIGDDDPDFDTYPEGIFIHDNELAGGGDEPDALVAAAQAIIFPDGGQLPDIVWDGAADPDKLVDGEPAPESRLCVQEADDVEVLDADAANGFANPSIGIDAFDCTLEPIEPAVVDGA